MYYSSFMYMLHVLGLVCYMVWCVFGRWMVYVVLCCLELVVVRGIPVHHGEDGQPRASGQSIRAASVFRWEFLAGRLSFCGRRGIEDGDPCDMACLRSLERRSDLTSCDCIVVSGSVA